VASFGFADASTLGGAGTVDLGRRGEIASAARWNFDSTAGRRRCPGRRDTVEIMWSRVLPFLRDPRVHLAGDGLLVFALAGTSVGSIFARDDPSWGHPKAVAVALALLSTVPLVLRSRWPFAAAFLVFAGQGACMIAAAPRQAAFQPFVALMFASYSLGSGTSGRRAAFGPVILFVLATLLGVVALVDGTHGGDVIPSLVWLAAAWGLGLLVRSWRSRAAELEQANRELEEQRELQAQAAVAVERGRIARELHDVIAHNVSMMVVQAAAAARVLAGDEPDVRGALRAIETTGRETVDEMRRLLGVLRRADDGLALAPQPGLRDLESLVAHVREAGLPVELHVEGEPVALPPGLDLSAYRIVQEALTNALKHAGEARAEVTLRYETGAVRIEVHDDGAGAADGFGSGHGLIGMRERVALWGGQLDAGRADGGGWAVRALLPLGAAPA